MSKQIFVNLPVKNLNRAVSFFTHLGFSFNQEFTDENATCMVVSDNIFVMLLVEPFFQTFTKKEVADATRTAEVIVALSAGSRGEVNDYIRKAVEAGGTTPNEATDHGWMYVHGFQDPDGHLWEFTYMEQQQQ
ncbi:VOC family protein [Paraflavisolibacter sp. H34]|uniref:VOC family protein n=1 Tax=Huijunlia imazamoxiresistens TaxID=3127457 RepID=UPI003019D1F9